MAPTKCMQDEVVVITGAGRGIGREIALLAAAEGANVVVDDYGGGPDGGGPEQGTNARPADDVVAEIQPAGGIAVANTAAVAEPEAAASIVQTAMDTYGRLDCVVNNAGILRDRIFHKMIIHDFKAVIDVHLIGSSYVSHAAAQVFRAQESGTFVHFTSTARLIGNFDRPTTPPPSSASSACRNPSRSTWRATTSAPTASRRLRGAA